MADSARRKGPAGTEDASEVDDLAWGEPGIESDARLSKAPEARDSIPVDVTFDTTPSSPPASELPLSKKPTAKPPRAAKPAPPRPRSRRTDDGPPTVKPAAATRAAKADADEAAPISLPASAFQSEAPSGAAVPVVVPKAARTPTITNEATPSEPAAAAPLPAMSMERCGPYRLCFELAQGGMASVYLARREGPGGFDKLVALKRVHSHLRGEEEFNEMFLDEARVASRITHPNVCSIVDFGTDDGQYFLAMDYLFGEPLSAVRSAIFEDKALLARSLPFAVKIVADACEGLHAAHELTGDDGELLNVVHRDISPQNIFVSYDGTAKVVDFGIAKARGRLHRTATGVLKGHLAYMAPEQFGSSDVDRKTDVWALGVLLWELAAGVRLFEQKGNIASTVTAVMNAPIRSLNGLRRELPPELDAIAMRALARNPHDRYSTARDMGRDLLHFLHNHCDATGPADVSEWMVSLFPKQRAEKMRLLLEARRAR